MKTFKKMRGLTDQQLGAALANHTEYLRGLVAFANQIMRERRLGLVWGVVVTAALIWLGVR